MLFTDWNRSGTPSLRVSNDREYYKGGQEQMWHVEPGKPPVALHRRPTAGSSCASGAWASPAATSTATAIPDYFLTSMADNKLQTLAAPPRDGTRSPASRTWPSPRASPPTAPIPAARSSPRTAWHAQFEDVNNDGLADLFIAKGNVAEMPDFATKDPNNLLLQDAEGKFPEVGDKAGVASMKISRGAALADFNLDGRIDLVVVNRWESAQLWRNTGAGQPDATGSHWIGIALDQALHNRDGVGSWVEVRTGETVQRREITVGGGHAGGQSGWWHFGLGDAATAEVRVIWPDGTEGPWQTVDADRFYTARSGEAPKVWSPG